MGRAVKEDERPTSNIQRPTSNEKDKHPIPNIAEFRFFEKVFIPRKSTIATQNRWKASKLGGREAGKGQRSEVGGQRAAKIREQGQKAGSLA